MKNALIIGNSDGVGLALTRQLLADGWQVTGISRSPCPVEDEALQHVVLDVRDTGYPTRLESIWDQDGPFGTCVYCAGVGEKLDPAAMEAETTVFEVNLLGAVRTISAVVPRMIAAGGGHFIGISSQADALVNAGAPSYSASKAGLSSYLHSLALAVRPRGVHVTNVRFGFIATKMARGEVRPFEVSADVAAARIVRCMRKRPIRHTYPRRMAVLLWLVRWPARLRLWWS